MKKKFLGAISLVLVCTMATASLTGCGTQAEATNQEVEDGETVIVTGETATDTEDGITGTGIVGEEEATFAGAENEDILLYADKGEKKHTELAFETFENYDVTFTAREEIPLINGYGYEVGYIKAGGSVTVTGSLADLDWARFENPIEGTDYEYLYLMKSSIPAEGTVYVTAEDIKPMIIDRVNNRAYELPTILDAPTEDMEVHEFVIAKEYKSQLDLEDAVTRGYSDDYSGGAMGYMNYYIECEEEENIIRCKIYYKDEYVNPNPR